MMDIKHRQQDVKELVCKACQGFIRLLLPDNWQQTLFKELESLIRDKHADNYIGAYEKMCDKGIENYHVEDMDTAFISNLIRFSSVINTTASTKKAIAEVASDRNLYGHTSENEEAEELYLRALLSLVILRKFICTIQVKEMHIDENVRLAYRQKYIQLIQGLMDVLDSERIELIQRDKDIDKDIQKVLNSETPEITWCKLEEKYSQIYWKLEKDPDRYFDFVIRASDAGIQSAHSLAAGAYICREQYDLATQKIILLYNSYDKLPPYLVDSTVRDINTIIYHTKKCPQAFEKIIEDLVTKGAKIEKGQVEEHITDNTGRLLSTEYYEGFIVKGRDDTSVKNTNH